MEVTPAKIDGQGSMAGRAQRCVRRVACRARVNPRARLQCAISSRDHCAGGPSRARPAAPANCRFLRGRTTLFVPAREVTGQTSRLPGGNEAGSTLAASLGSHKYLPRADEPLGEAFPTFVLWVVSSSFPASASIRPGRCSLSRNGLGHRRGRGPWLQHAVGGAHLLRIRFLPLHRGGHLEVAAARGGVFQLGRLRRTTRQPPLVR